MQPVKFKQQNLVYTKPEGWTDQECTDLPTYRGVDGNGHPVVISKWKLDDREIDEINKTRSLYLCVCTHVLPPVSIHVDSPFTTDAEQPSEGRKLQVSVGLEFDKEHTYIDVRTGDVPKSLILEALSNLTQQIANELVQEALQEVPEDGVGGYMNGRLKIDREEMTRRLSEPTKTKIITLGK